MIPFETYARIDAAREHAELAEAQLWYMVKVDDDSTLAAGDLCRRHQ